VTDLNEMPAVPPVDAGGDERAGMIAAGGVLIVLGWGLGVLANLYLHWSAPAGGSTWGGITVPHALGALAWATLVIGLGTGAIGFAMAWLARSEAKAPLVLPGHAY
jgi:hypothetical protein